MSQVFTDQYDTNNDVVNNNQPEWSKILPRNGMILNENCSEGTNVYSGGDANEKRFAGKSNLKPPPKPADTRFTNIQEGLESSISVEGKERIQRILDDVGHLSDVEKLLLYLKLPTGATPDDALRQTPTSFLHSSNRIEQAQAFTWIRSHLEEDCEICVPKHEVYDDYRLYCESHSLKPLCPADFGKVMKCVFPNVKPRRLGQRGQSKYCYSGLRKKLEVQPPSLPELEITPKRDKEEKGEGDEVHMASRQLVCEWAHKLLGTNFSNLRELAEYLVGNLYVNSKSTAAFTVLAAMQDAGVNNSKVPVSSLFTCNSGGNKHKETQLQLQRKLQERELIKEQKRKLQQQRSENERENEQFRLQTASVSPSPFQSSVRSAARNITKLLQSPGMSDHAPPTPSPTMKASPRLIQSPAVGPSPQQVKGERRLTEDYSGMEVSMETDSVKTSVDSKEDNVHFHVVKKPAVRQPGDDSAVIQIDSDKESSNSETSSTEKANEGVLFALPTTPSRSAFVPVSIARKDQNMVITDSMEQSEMILVDTIDSFEAKMECKTNSSPVQLSSDNGLNVSSSPQTPKKSKSRFTPIRPKVTPTKTVSSILKDQKPTGEGPTYDSRPVSAILKEKRAREAKDIMVQLASSVQIKAGNVGIHGHQVPPNVTVPVTGMADGLRLPVPAKSVPKSNEVLIIVGSPKPGSAMNGPPLAVTPNGMDILTSSQFPPNVTAPMSHNTVPLALLLSRQEEAKAQSRKRIDSNSLDNSDYSDSGNITDSEMVKSDESQDMCISRDIDTPSGRKRKSSDREIESKNKRINSINIRMDDDEVFVIDSLCSKTPSVQGRVPVTQVNEVPRTNALSKDAKPPKDTRVSRGNLSLESLESDALLDTAPMAVDQSLVSSISTTVTSSTKTASVGVSAKTLRPSQKQLMQQKLQLDQRVNNFFSKGGKVGKEENRTEEVKVIDKARVEQIIQQYMQQQQQQQQEQQLLIQQQQQQIQKQKQQKAELRQSAGVSHTPKTPNNHPSNLLSLLQQPVFDCKKVVLSTVSKTKVDDSQVENSAARSEQSSKPQPEVKNQQPMIIDTPQKTNISKNLNTQTEKKNNVVNNLNLDIEPKSSVVVDIDEDSSDLPSDVADFITENMLGSKDGSTVPLSVCITQQLAEIQSLGIRTKIESLMAEEGKSEGRLEGSNLMETFTVPSTPPPPRQKPVDPGGGGKLKFSTVQRSSSLPVPPVSGVQSHTSFMSLGKGLDMPAPPNRVIDSSSPQSVLHKVVPSVNFTNPGRQRTRMRKTSTDQHGNQTPISDAGYHSFDASPVMISTPLPIIGNSDSIIPIAVSTTTMLPRPESAQSNDPLPDQSPIPLLSPQTPSAQSTPNSVMSPHIAGSQSSIGPSPIESITSPNSFVPIQGSLSSSPLGSPQMVTPIKPRVTLASSSSTVSTPTTTSILMKLTSADTKELLQSAILQSQQYQMDKQKQTKPMETKDSGTKTGVLQKLLNSTSLPSYEEAVTHLGRGKQDDKEEKAANVGNVFNSKTVSATVSRSLSCSDQETRVKHDTPVLKETLERGISLPDNKVIPTSEYPFSYQLALLREKCLNLPGKENKVKDATSATGQSVHRKQITVKPAEQKTVSGDNPVTVIEDNKHQTQFIPNPSKPASSSIQPKANITHHHYGNATQKSTTVTMVTSEASAAPSVQASKLCAPVRIAPNTTIHTRTSGSGPQVSTATSAQQPGRQRQTGSSVYPTLDLPNVNYMGNAPNIDLGSILSSKQHGVSGLSSNSSSSSSSGGSGESQMTLMQALQPTQTINEEELQSTLEILRSLDSQYFSQADLDMDTMQPSSQHSQYSNHSNKASPSHAPQYSAKASPSHAPQYSAKTSSSAYSVKASPSHVSSQYNVKASPSHLNTPQQSPGQYSAKASPSHMPQHSVLHTGQFKLATSSSASSTSQVSSQAQYVMKVSSSPVASSPHQPLYSVKSSPSPASSTGETSDSDSVQEHSRGSKRTWSYQNVSTR